MSRYSEPRDPSRPYGVLPHFFLPVLSKEHCILFYFKLWQEKPRPGKLTQLAGKWHSLILNPELQLQSLDKSLPTIPMGSLKEGLLWCPDSAKKAQDSFPVKR
jgi:hypothetical protein